MAVQIEVDEMKGCPGYFEWMMKGILGDNCSDLMKSKDKSCGAVCGSTDECKKCAVYCYWDNAFDCGVNCGEYCADGSIVNICRAMFETDFICCLGTEDTIKNDEIRAKDAMELRRRYAAVVGSEADKSERDIDRIWKSVHGKCSVLELILSICYRLDTMVNEDEPGAMVGMFFMILIRNMGFDLSGKKDNREHISAVIDRFLKRNYEADGSGGGLFPLKKWSAEGGSKDQRTVSIWYQMGTWLNEHLDDEAHFRE